MRNFTSLMIASALVVPVMTNAANYQFKHVDVQSRFSAYGCEDSVFAECGKE